MRTLLLASLLLIFGEAQAVSTDEIMAECWKDRGHPEMSQCVSDRAKASHAELEKTEREMRAKLATISRDTEYPPGYVVRVRNYLNRSDGAYRQYRLAACALHYEFASIGNGPDDAKRACEAALDDQRVKELREAGWWIWK
jgi:uncharacterized protein YecT (DUF1311 family)